MTSETIALTTIGQARWITLNRPRVLNAMNRQCIEDCIEAVRAAEDSPNVRTIVLTGAGDRAFTAGADIGEIQGFGPTEVLRYNRDWLDLFRRIEWCRKPVIACVKGWSTGGGTELSLACDFVICGESARFGLAEINIGVIPGAGAGVRLTRSMGRLKAKELLLLGRFLDGREAVEWGLANRCVPDADVDRIVKELCEQLAEKAPLALGAAKASINIGSEASFDVALEYELQEFVRLFSTSDQKEGMSAFLEKRKPKYHGR
jgi:enoyl-CoA hydratase/carnithine racemase